MIFRQNYDPMHEIAHGLRVTNLVKPAPFRHEIAPFSAKLWSHRSAKTIG